MKLYLPSYSEKTIRAVQNEVVEVKAFQIIVWVSVSTSENSVGHFRMPKFPAILDKGTTHNFAVTDTHLIKWAGIHATVLRERGRIRVDRMKASLRRAGLWLQTDNDPFQLNCDEGLAVFDGNWPRLPILGLRALTNGKLRVCIDGDTKRVAIRTPPKWYGPF